MRGTSSDALRELARARSVVLTTHINPDGDALGSMIALYLFLQRRGIQVQMWLDDNLPVMYSFLPHLDKIARPPVTPQPLAAAPTRSAGRPWCGGSSPRR